MRYLLLAVLISISATASAQFGLQSVATFNSDRTDYPDLEGFGPYEFDTGYEVSLNYWFRLPTRRIEFQPTVYYGRSENLFGIGLTEYGVQLRTNLYIFDLANDCDCPTFGKQGPQLQKGFFLQLTPGYARYAFDLTTAEDKNNGGVTLGAAVGLDVGLSNLLTITPIAGLRYGLDGFTNELNLTDVNGQSLGAYTPKLVTYYAGIQFTFRLDKKRY